MKTKLPILIITLSFSIMSACNSTPPAIAAKGEATPASTQKTASGNSSSVSSSEMIDAHNTVRSQHKLPGLKWSNKLASYAQQWADLQKSSNGCRAKHRPNPGQSNQEYGENLYWASAITWPDGKKEMQKTSAQDVVKHWASEKQFYNHSSNSCQAGKICGHYTQIVWKNSTEVGCGIAVCADKSQLWVCNYNPSGNYSGQRPY